MRKENPKCQKKNFFFPSVFGKKMNDKRNLICRNVMLLSQSCDENSFVRLCKIFSLRGEKKTSYLLVVDL